MNPRLIIGAIHRGLPNNPSLTANRRIAYAHLTTVPQRSIRQVQYDLAELLVDAQRDDPDLNASVSFYLGSNGLELPSPHPGDIAVERAQENVTGESAIIRPHPERHSIWSDNSPLAEFGIAGISYGAGEINGNLESYSRDTQKLVRSSASTELTV